MANDYVNMDLLKHLLFDVHDAASLSQYERFQDYDDEAFLTIINAFKDFSDKACFPYLREMDEKPVYFKDGQVYVHPQVKNILEQAGELGLISGTFNHEEGGLQLPNIISQASYFLIDAANNHVAGYPGLTAGAADLIATFGNEALKELYLPKMLAGEWGGTMCLTEPQAGSSLSDITTSAIPTEEGYYRIEGQKIWISGGDHQHTDNIIHLVLARIEGSPQGTKGISLFVVPKKRIESNGEFSPNGVETAGDFQKLGQRGYSSVHLVFGDGEETRGWLVGAPNQGLKYMFKMMNGARIAVGRSAVAIIHAAYHASLKYANERPQGRRLTRDGSKDLSEGQTLIINHPDVRRMLLLQKAIAEGTLSLIFQASYYLDRETVAESDEERLRYNTLLELLTPVVKTYPSEMGQTSVSNGLQILGGMGFSSEHILQQYYRDIRIMAIYEGTTGIQSIDLLGRKVMMNNGKALQYLGEEIESVVKKAMGIPALKDAAQVLIQKLDVHKEVLKFLVPFAKMGDFERFLSDATIYMELFGTIIVGWQWLKMGLKASEKLEGSNSEDQTLFLESQIHTMQFFFKYEMHKVDSAAKTLMSQKVLTIKDPEKEYII